MHRLTRNQEAERPPLDARGENPRRLFIVKLTAIVPTCGACNKLVKKNIKKTRLALSIAGKGTKDPELFFFDFLRFFQLTMKQHKKQDCGHSEEATKSVIIQGCFLCFVLFWVFFQRVLHRNQVNVQIKYRRETDCIHFC